MQNEWLSYIQECLETDGHEILKKIDTRWLSLESSINRIIEQYSPLVSYLDSLESTTLPRDSKKKSLRKQLKKKTTKYYLIFLSNVLFSVNKFSLLYQLIFQFTV